MRDATLITSLPFVPAKTGTQGGELSSHGSGPGFPLARGRTEWVADACLVSPCEIDNDLDVAVAALKCLLPVRQGYATRNQAGKPLPVGFRQGLRSGAVVTPVGVDRAKNYMIFQHDGAIE